MNIDVSAVGKPFQFLASLITAIKTYGEQIGRPMVYNDLMSIFTGQHRLWKQCYQCNNVFYEDTVFDYIVFIFEGIHFHRVWMFREQYDWKMQLNSSGVKIVRSYLLFNVQCSFDGLI